MSKMSASLEQQNPLWGLPWEGASEHDSCESWQRSNSTSPSRTEGDCDSLVRQGSEPIRFRLVRSHSELELEESERAAEYRDYCMYHLIVSSRSCNDITKNAKRVKEPQYTRSKTDMTGSPGADLEDKASTPVLCNAPLTLLELHAASRTVFPPSASPTRQYSLAEAIRSVEAVDDDRSIDDVFDFDP